MTKEQAVKELAEKVAEAYAALDAAKVIANEHGLEFSFSPAYGMGGYYTGKDEHWDGSDDDDWESSYGWSPSSQSC